MVENDVILDLENISFSYPNHGKILDNLNFRLRAGEKVGLIGPNGSGKSTFLHVIMGLLRPDSGNIRILGKLMETEQHFREVRQNVGFLFQNADDQLFSPTVLEDVAFGPLNMGKPAKEAIEMSLKTLEELNLIGFENRITYKLSGGEKKLVSLATVLVMKPKVLLLDEPTTGLDEETNERIISILNSLDISYVIVSHEFDFLSLTTEDIYCIQCGEIAYNCKSSHFHLPEHVKTKATDMDNF
jgi:cobalt/nickel transport system ATP-binding protein